ncbi:MAG: type II toxin-antitoxin system VapC family toxin, partial [Defluviitaleaceae bacterium]|nr:type II toxin-antitoxin system VapC family toxin [Defluviitaleaceae bacterium]
MRKLKLYLDTSTISHLFAEDTPDKMNETNELWQDFINDKYDVYISHVVIDEVERCPEPKQGKMLEKLRLIKFQILPETDEVINLANEYIKGGVLKEKSIADCRHIAHAVVYHCDAIVSWNFEHLVNFKTINKVKVVNAMFHYKE